MFSRILPLVIILTISASAAEVRPPARDPNPLVVHEWGTFTSIADVEGQPLVWTPLAGQSDLPCFVYRTRELPKTVLAGTVRMETPVLYFYSTQPAIVDVSLRFNQGLITEWFPRADVPTGTGPLNLAAPGFYRTMKWEDVKITPRGKEDFPIERASSHYYAARATDAAPVETGSEKEKFLFYRGVGRFPLPLTAAVEADGRVRVKAADRLQPIATAILFTNQNGRIGYSVARGIAGEQMLEMPAAGASDAALRQDLEQLLIAEGLFAREAQAMVETWRDSWFEEGTRLFYVVPQASVDAVLPLQIKPQPTQVARVFVGRLELITPAMIDRVRQAIVSGDAAALAKHGRFLDPIVNRLITIDRPRVDLSRIKQLKQAAFETNLRSTAWCTGR